MYFDWNNLVIFQVPPLSHRFRCGLQPSRVSIGYLAPWQWYVVPDDLSSASAVDIGCPKILFLVGLAFSSYPSRTCLMSFLCRCSGNVCDQGSRSVFSRTIGILQLRFDSFVIRGFLRF